MNAPTSPSPSPLSRYMDRRGFVRTTAYTGGSLLLLTSKSAIAQQTSPGRTIKCALIGCGAQGNAIRTASADVPGIQWVAICDIWKFSQAKTRGGMLGENKHQVEGDVKVYDDVLEMLEKEPSIEACFIATPDFLHAPNSRLCLEKGKAVYCEKMMSNTIEGARDMVRAHKEHGGIFQIGHQRHSNPRYINLRENIIRPGNMMGRVTHCYAQWNRGVSASQALTGQVKSYELSDEILQKNGYQDIFQFRNWRFFKEYGGGPISDLGAHQIDMFNWMYQATPVSLFATGGVDYYDGTDGKPKYELPDNVMCIYEYKLPDGVMRAYYQVLTTTGSQGAYEKHMGVQGSAIISELPTSGNQVYAEPNQDWSSYALGDDPIIVKATDKARNKFWEQNRSWQKPLPPSYGKVSTADVRESKALDQWELGVTLNRKPHSPHVQNFIEAVQMNKYEHLTCPVEQGFQCAVTVLKAYESIEKKAPVDFSPQDFEV